MNKFTTITAIAAPLNRANIDTDAIMPKQFLKSVERTGFGDFIFDEWRYLDSGEYGMDCSKRPKNNDFVLNQTPYTQAQILLTGDNFGCGSSREHAPWGLVQFGFKVIIAPSFAEIFYNNSVKNGLLCVALNQATVNELFSILANNKGMQLTVNLEQQTVSADNKVYKFDINSKDKEQLLTGLDDIGKTLQLSDKIKAYEASAQENTPWVF